ncbi:MAG: hypothetical protein IVW57_12255 [Ktedonobacterales bacterium]|nr:hypothetical protein [Ktedonobacterales bacterium]
MSEERHGHAPGTSLEARVEQETITALAGLRRRGATVRAIGAALGLDAARLAQGEARDRLEVTAHLPVAQLEALGAGEAVRAWFATLGEDLALDLALAGLDASAAPVTATLRAGSDAAATLATFRAAAAAVAATQGADVSVEARLAVGKSLALVAARAVRERQPGGGAAPLITVYYSAAAWQRLLVPGNLPLWERHGQASKDERARVILCDTPGYLAGVALEVVGAAGDEPPRWLAVSRAAWRQFTARADEYRRLCADENHWSMPPLSLTPDHLRVEARAAGLEATARRLAGLRAALAAAYLASATHGTFEDGLTLRFAGPRPATCALSPEAAGADGAEAEEAGEGALARLAAWAYAHGSPDKLAMARECLARELPAGSVVSLAALERAALPALAAAQANFTLYLRGRTEQYFTLRQAAQEAVAGYAEAVRKSVGDLTSDVVENVYRTAGLAVAIFIAWLIQPAASLWVLRLGALLYTVYVALVLWLVVRARHDRYTREGEGLRQRLAGMPELTEGERKGIRAAAAGDDAYFQTYYRRARWAYRALLALGLVALVVFSTPLARPITLTPPTATPTHSTR